MEITPEMVAAGMTVGALHGVTDESVVRAILVAGEEARVGAVSAMPECFVEIDDGSMTFRQGTLSISVCAETATVYDASRQIPARKVALSYDHFWTQADDFLCPVSTTVSDQG